MYSCRDRWHVKGSLTLSSRSSGPATTTYGVASTHASQASTPCKVHRLAGAPGGEYGYTHVWEVQQGPTGLTTLTPHPHLSAHYAAFRECEHHGGGGGGGDRGVPTVLYRCADTCEQHIEDLTHPDTQQMPPFYHDNNQDAHGTLLKQHRTGNTNNKHHADCPMSAHPVGEHDTDEELDIQQRQQQQNGGYHLVPSSPDKDMPTITGHLEHNHYS